MVVGIALVCLCLRSYQTRTRCLQEAATTVAADQLNELVVVGTQNGMFSVLDAEKGDHLFSYQATQAAIECMQFSPGTRGK